MKNIRILLYTVLALLLLSACDKQPQILVKRVIFPGDYPDPSIVRDGNDFYMTSSSMTYYPGLLVWHSTDLRNWEPISFGVTAEQDYSIFAPDICKVGGKFYIYYPTSAGVNYVVTADDPHGPWSDPILIEGAHGIDPGHVFAEDGRQYLYTNNGYCVQLTDDGLAAVGEERKLYDGWQYPEDWDTEGFWLESPKLFKRGEYYYLVTAEGGTAGPPTSHMCVVARSKSALGPWENSPYNPLVHTYYSIDEWWSKGHGTIFDDAEGNWYVIYHAYRNSYHTLGRSTIIESVVWTEDGWPKLADEKPIYIEDTPDHAQYATLRDASNPLLWTDWAGGFGGARLSTFRALDTAYELTARFEVPAGGQGGLYLFYNEKVNFGASFGEGTFWLRIINDNHNASIEKSPDGTTWETVESGVDVSSYHHNIHGGFFSLRPSILSTEGVKVSDVSYTKLNF